MCSELHRQSCVQTLVEFVQVCDTQPKQEQEAIMSRQFTLCFSGLLLMAATFSSAFAQAQTPTSPGASLQRTPWGDPDLQGVWDRRTITPLQRPDRFAGKAFLTPAEITAYELASAARDDGRPLDYGRAGISVHDPADLDYGKTVLPTGQTSLIVAPADGRIPPLTPAAKARLEAARTARAGRGPADSWLDRSLTERCLTWGVPQGMLPQAYNNNIQIVQTRNEVMILIEMVHDVRIIPLDGRPHLPAQIRQWHGDPRGHWEGDTLVVDSRNFSSQSNFQNASENLHLVERFTRLGHDTLLYEFTVEDDTTWTHPWTVSFPMQLGDQPVYEFACHEGNYGLLNILGAARALEREGQ
jgi:hypothetical protein